MDLSAKMPAKMDSQLDARMPAKMDSDAPAFAGEGGSDDAPVVPIKNTSVDQRGQWDAVDRERGLDWQTKDRLHGPTSWEAGKDRINNGEGGLPQRDPDNDGDLN